ncbi:oxygen-independent coproporphyrinogen III oxidase [Caldimonas sp. KR1-144]|uniref:oxygen-independent coproporphyrinogen III oxidase n=1 Tax=Caldimonas sp. KR1-144 TaxID=3400911 RepID=UPI003C076166
MIDAELLRRFSKGGPRYTSYPTADRFVEAFGAEQYLQALAQRREGGALHGGEPLSVYVHIPFCESLCYYCACNKVVTRQHGRAEPYLAALETEMALQAQALGPHRPVAQLHLGGGTPTFLSDAELLRLMTSLRRSFALQPGAECSIEVDPRTVDTSRLAWLAELGFNRISFGVQDLDAAVQQAVHRVQPLEQIEALMRDARALGFESINVDLIHGLPRQTTASFARTVREIARLRPDRIALYAYAHLPQRFKPQRRIVAEELPGAGERVALLAQAIDGFLEAGYEYIGMDHFALPGDSLAVARRQGRLHRSFQGYCTQPDGDLIALGVSAIGRVGATYSQNTKDLAEYQELLAAGVLPVVRGLALSRDDLLRRAVIMALMCQGRLAFESIELAHLIDFRTYFAEELAELQALADDGLVTIDADGLEVTPLGWYFVRVIAMVFDRPLRSDRAREHYSKVI